jgi:tRNA(Ile)-lysidine synthase
MSVHLLEIVANHLLPRAPERIGVAVSGGGDSVALLCLLAELSREMQMEVHAISIDHGLREAAMEEVRAVTDLCGDLGVPHHVEYWNSWNGEGNLMAEARTARYDLLTDWARANDVNTIALGHTANDQAETLLMRLARGAGVDGLSAMSPRRISNGVVWLRPLLRVHRRQLRHYLQSKNIPWVEDPTNEDRSFERIRMRDALQVLEPLGIDIDTLVTVTEHMSQAREALDWQTFLTARDMVRVSHGALAIDVHRFRPLPEELRRRIIVHALGWLTNSDYPPRREAIQSALVAIREGRTFTLSGCMILRSDDLIWLCREYNAVQADSVEVGDLWDGRWVVNGPEDDPEIEVRALGEKGLQNLLEKPSEKIPRPVLAVTPGVWMEGELLAAPLAEKAHGWTAELENGKDAFFAALLSH